MAKRIMYSILPGVAGPTQTMATQGVVDYNALKAAVEGRKDLIKYGVAAAIKELTHYEGSLSSSELGGVPAALARGRPYHIAGAFAAQGNYAKAMDIAMKLFEDEDGWPPAYGGAAWFRIAKSLKHMIELDKNLDAVRANRAKDPDYMDKEMNIMQQLVVEMNVFDGLSHNTASIMEKLVMEEAHAKPDELLEGKDLNEEIGTEFNSIQRMMDAKELRNPVQVFREIEPSLVESGDINRYKDWTSPLRRDPSYRAEDPNLEAEKFQIRLRKQITPLRIEINTRRDFMRKGIERILSAGPESLMNVYRILDTKVEEFANIIDRLIQLIDDQYYKPIQEAEFPISDTLRAGPVTKLREGLSKLSMDARLKVEMARHNIAPVLQKYHQQKKKGVIQPTTIKEFQSAIYEVMKLIYEGYGSLAFYLDSI